MTNDKAQMTNEIQNLNVKSKTKIYDLEERTAKFGEEIIKFAQKIPKNSITLPLISQLVRAGTSIGANYQEADGAGTSKEFHHRISICKREAKETKHWLRMISVTCSELQVDIDYLSQEARELSLIFSAINRK